MTKLFDIISCQTDEVIETIDDETLTLYRRAPELLTFAENAEELARKLLAEYGLRYDLAELLDESRAAIAKAKGETP